MAGGRPPYVVGGYAPDVSTLTIQQAIASGISDGTLKEFGNTKGSRYVVSKEENHDERDHQGF